jgi:hypothetical protein
VLGHDDAVGHDRPYDLVEYREHARAEGGLVYDFDVQRKYGIP